MAVATALLVALFAAGAPVASFHVGQGAGDSDGDFLLDTEEAMLGTDPLDDDTDGDGAEDGVELLSDDPADPLEDDVDDDGLLDGEEYDNPLIGVDDACPYLDTPDSDGDGSSDGDEALGGGDTDPCTGFDADLDGDGDYHDNCPTSPNPDQADADLDGLGDACDGETSVFVLVQAANGSAQPGVFVDVFGDYGFNDVFYETGAVTDGAGEAPITALPAGHFLAFACADGLGCGETPFLSTGGNVTTVSIPDAGGAYTVVTDTVTVTLDDGFFGYVPPDENCGGTLTGIVLDDGGLPVEGVNVNAGVSFGPGSSGEAEGGSGWGWALTGPDGSFTITNLGNAVFDLFIDGTSAGLTNLFAMQAFEVEGASLDLCDDLAVPALVDPDSFLEGAYALTADGYNEFTLTQGITISGTVSDGAGDPVEGAFVDAHTRFVGGPGDMGPQAFGFAQTDATGAFTIIGLTPMDDSEPTTGYDVFVEPPAGSGLSRAFIAFPDDPLQGDADTGSPDTLGSADGNHTDARLDFVLEQAATLSGRLSIDGSGEGVAGAWLNLWAQDPTVPSWAWGESDFTGNYSVAGLRYDAEGVAYGMFVQPPVGSGLGSLFLDNIVMDEVSETLNITLEAGVGLSGCVEDPDGGGVEGAWVSVFQPGSFGGWAIADGDGCFTVYGLQAETYGVFVYAPWESGLTNRNFFDVTLDAASPGYNDAILDATDDGFALHDEGGEAIVLATAGSITGCVISADGGDAGTAADEVVGAWVGAWSGTTMQWGGGVTDVDGCFTVTGLGGADDYFLSVWPPFDSGLAEFTQSGVAVEDGLETPVTDGVDTGEADDTDESIYLGTGHTLIGDVVDENGDPVGGVEVCAWREDGGGFGWTMTDADGHFEIRGLPTPGDADAGQGWFLWLGVPEGYVHRMYPGDPFSGTVSALDAASADNEDTTQADSPTGESLAGRALVLGVSGRMAITLSADDAFTYVDTNSDTDASGTVTIDDDVFDSDGDGLVGAADAADEDNEYADGDGEQPIVLAAGTTLDGFVVDSDGAGIAGAQLWLWSPTGAGWGHAETAADGSWSVRGMGDGDFDLWLDAGDGRTKYETGSSGDDDLGCQVDAATGDDSAGDTDTETLDGCAVAFEAPGTIEANVIAGPDSSGVLVHAYGPSFASGVTDGNGQAVLDNLAPGTYTVRFYRADCYVLFETDLVVDPTDGTPEYANVTLAAASLLDLEGLVLDGDGGAPVGAGVLVLAHFEDGAGNVATYTTATDGDGRYLFEDVPEGDYTLLAVLDATNDGTVFWDGFATPVLEAGDAADTAAADSDGDGLFDDDGDGAVEAPDIEVGQDNGVVT